MLLWVSLDRDTGCHALSVAGTVSLCTRLSVATFAITSDLVRVVVTGRIRCDLIGSKLCNARNCKEVNFCTSSVATANIPPSKIIGNQKKSGTAQLLEVGPRSRMSIVRPAFVIPAFAILQQTHPRTVWDTAPGIRNKPAVSKPCVEVAGSKSQFSVKQNYFRNLSTVRNSSASRNENLIHNGAFCSPKVSA